MRPYVYMYYSHDYSVSPLVCHAHDRRERGQRRDRPAVKNPLDRAPSTEYISKKKNPYYV